MNRPCAVLTGVCALVGLGWLSACDAPPPTPQAQANAATRSACERRANQVYEQQNRGDIYSPQSQVNTPYSANYLPDNTNRGLSDLFAHDRLVSDCIRNTGTGTERTLPATLPAQPGETQATAPRQRLPLPPPPPAQ